MCDNYIFYGFITNSILLLISEFLPFTSVKYHGIVKNLINCCGKYKKEENQQNEQLLENKNYDSDTEYSLYTDIETVKQKLNVIIDEIKEIKEIKENQELENRKIEKINLDNRWFFQKMFDK